MITYAVEGFKAVADMKTLLESHYTEICAFPEVQIMAPDYELYKRRLSDGSLRLVVARDDGDLVGYCATLLSSSLHYRTTVHAVNDVLFVVPSHRGKMTGYRLLKLAMKDAKDSGAALYTMHMKIAHPFRSLLRRAGLNCIEEVWSGQL